MALKKTEDRIIFDRTIQYLRSNPNEFTAKVIKAIAQEFMLSENFSVNGVTFEPQSKHLGTGVYQISYKKKGTDTIKM